MERCIWCGALTDEDPSDQQRPADYCSHDPPPRRVEFVVYGVPGPQGSKRFLGVQGGKGRMIESSKKVAPWRESVMWAAKAALGPEPMFDGPLRVTMVFTVAKPKSAPKRKRTWPMSVPDGSKLVRSTEDALTACGFWRDDARVVECMYSKRYPGEGDGSLPAPGARIVVEEVR